MRQRAGSGRPLGDADFVKEIGQLLSRDLMPKKPGSKGPKKNSGLTRMALDAVR
ncbi:MAG: hypothetical protein QGH60_15620 [Phycisphaerae bacterium]|jgi:hypothetical protein|nr:hypothetical protein [Phycisphaerae bacterium]